MGYTTIRDAYADYCRMHGSETPSRTLEELRDRIHDAGLRYEQIGEEFWTEAFDSGWAYGTDTES